MYASLMFGLYSAGHTSFVRGRMRQHGTVIRGDSGAFVSVRSREDRWHILYLVQCICCFLYLIKGTCFFNHALRLISTVGFSCSAFMPINKDSSHLVFVLLERLVPVYRKLIETLILGLSSLVDEMLED